MKLTFLGTGAADWNWRDHHEDPEYRRNSALLIDDCLLIDPGPDVPDALAAFGKTPERIRYMKATLEKYVGRFVISHMARTLHASHKELSLSVGKDGIEAAYDGFETEV